MTQYQTAAAILTLALWNNKEKATNLTDDDWKLVVNDYAKILSALQGDSQS